VPRLPTSSLGVSLGGGVKFALSEAIDIDLRYYYKIDNEIVNTHHILVGLVL